MKNVSQMVKTRKMVIEDLRSLINKYSENDQKKEDLFIDQELLVNTANILHDSPYDPYERFPNENCFIEDMSVAQKIALGIYNFLFDEEIYPEQFIRELDEIFKKIDQSQKNQKN